MENSPNRISVDRSGSTVGDSGACAFGNIAAVEASCLAAREDQRVNPRDSRTGPTDASFCQQFGAVRVAFVYRRDIRHAGSNNEGELPGFRSFTRRKATVRPMLALQIEVLFVRRS